MPHDFGRVSTEKLLFCWSAFCLILGGLPRGAFAGGLSVELSLVGCASAEQGNGTSNVGVAPASGSVVCSSAERGNVMISDAFCLFPGGLPLGAFAGGLSVE